jgi:hypothetical protein
MMLEFEIERWKDFRKALGSDYARQAFEAMMDLCRNNAITAGSGCNPIVF